MSIPSNIYQEIMNNVPIVTVDLIIFDKTKTKTLLFKRNNKPAKDIYYTLGGRLLKNEALDIAIKRKTKDEINLDLSSMDYHFGGTIQEFFEDSIYENISTHNINFFFYCILDNVDIKLDNQHENYKWFDINDVTIYHYVKEKINVSYSKLNGINN